jgi:hypothetical protein
MSGFALTLGISDPGWQVVCSDAILQSFGVRKRTLGDQIACLWGRRSFSKNMVLEHFFDEFLPLIASRGE